LIAAARRPLILAGDGVLHASASAGVMALATRIGAPVITTVLGKGAIPETHPWSLGDMNSDAGSRAYGASDLILAIGVRFVQVDTRWAWFKPPARLVHVDADAREIHRVFPADVGMVADPHRALLQLLDALGDCESAPGWTELFPDLKQRSDAREPLPILGALRRALPEEALAAFDVCYAGFRSRSDWTAYRPGGYYYPGVYVGMGFGLPVGIGAALATGSPTLVVAGDGGFQMTMAELATAAQENAPVVVVVVNDAGLTLIKHVQDREFGGRRYEVDLVNPDFVALAGAYGIPASWTSTPEELEVAVAAAVAARRPTLVEYRISA
jgi:acetolactate synthase-1/2/3 large subunit